MFESALKEKLQRIFDLKKSTFDLPGDSLEQECLFIQVDGARSTIKDGRELCRVNGRLRVFANTDKLPYGYFAKRIAAAPLGHTADLFFYDIEENAGQIQNIAERSMSFVYFHSAQYNPPAGEIESVNFGDGA